MIAKMVWWSLLSMALYANTLQELIALAYQNDPTLQMLKAEKKVAQSQKEISGTLPDPMLKAGLTDIQLEAIGDRSLEPMQTQFVAISQQIPMSARLQIEREIAGDHMHLVAWKIEARKRRLATIISTDCYRIAITQKRLQLLTQNRSNLLHIKQLLRGYQASADLLLEVDRTLLQLRVRKSRLKSRIAALKENIARYTYQKPQAIKGLSLKLSKQIDWRVGHDHPMLARYRSDIEIARKRIALSRALETPDITLGGGYYQREGRRDYLNLSVAMPLPIYGTQKRQTARAKALLAYQKSRLEALENRLENELEQLKIRLLEYWEQYHLYQQRLLPLQKRISAFLRARHAADRLDLSRVIESYNRYITLQMQMLDVLEKGLITYAKARYYR